MSKQNICPLKQSSTLLFQLEVHIGTHQDSSNS